MRSVCSRPAFHALVAIRRMLSGPSLQHLSRTHWLLQRFRVFLRACLAFLWEHHLAPAIWNALKVPASHRAVSDGSFQCLHSINEHSRIRFVVVSPPARVLAAAEWRRGSSKPCILIAMSDNTCVRGRAECQSVIILVSIKLYRIAPRVGSSVENKRLSRRRRAIRCRCLY